MDIHAFERRIEKYDFVTFDIFDTLLKRDVFQPTDVFELVQKIYKNQYKKDVDFKNIRKKAESIVREKSKYDEVTLDEIYESIDVPDKDRLKSLEIETESRLLHQNHDIKKYFDKCIELGKVVYIISDMYLPKNFLDEILHREGYIGYRDIILSADYRQTKRSGKLYSAFLENYNIKAQKVIHIGDSWYADYIGAKKANITALHIRRRVKNTLYMSAPRNNSDIDENSFFSFINNRISGIDERSEKLGYEVLGPILYGYCTWIHNNYDQILKATNDNVRLWFAARDMFLFNEAYRIIYSNSSSPDYMYISRKSLRPVLTTTTLDITQSGNTFPRGICSVGEIVKRMGYTLDDIDKTEFVDTEKLIDPRKLSAYPDIKKALSSPRILEKEKNMGAAGLMYLKKHGFDNSNIVFVDVGWHGTTQYILQRILDALGSKKTIYGLYFGCLDSTNEKIGIESYRAYAFDENNDSNFAKGVLLFESLILAPHGSTEKYTIKNGAVVPVLGKTDNQTGFLRSVQTGALKFVRDYKNSILSSELFLSSQICTKAFCNLTMKPFKEELNTIGQMDYDDFGISRIAAPDPLIIYLRHPRKLYNDLKHCPWRIGFIYKLLKVRLPYGKIYSFARKVLLNKKT